METGIERQAMGRHLDRASSVVIVLTFVLFVAALLVKGLTHDLFLETGVLLVSVKLILNTYHMEVHARRLVERIDDVHELLRTRTIPAGEGEGERHSLRNPPGLPGTR